MKFYWPAIALIILGIFIIVSPWTIAPVCEVNGMYAKLTSGKDFPMPCGWTVRAELGIGALVVVAGILLAFAKSAEAKMMVGIFGAVLGLLVILFPTVITKMCALADHPCNILTKPLLIILGLIVIIVSGWVIYTSRNEMGKDG
ncbi:MAG: DUF4418 family protein [Methanomicrobiales archaeon]|nr:DUF4418 family protein [Methanomicrobiales archaeon]